jgi:hypothetical protein
MSPKGHRMARLHAATGGLIVSAKPDIVHTARSA